VRFARDTTALAGRHVHTLMPDQTYLQQAQPSTFSHYVLSFVYPAMRDADRLLDEFDDINRSPAGAGCVNGTRLLDDRTFVAAALGFDDVIEHTRDAMWQIDGLIHVLASAASLLSTLSKLAEDLEIWSSSEFDFVDLDDAYTRSSVLMPQKRNPYSLSIVRGASGVLIGRLTGFLAVAKSPSARSDNLIFAYGEVPRALDLSIRITRLMTGVLRTLEVNVERMAAGLDAGYTQATDLSEFIVQTCGVDYRSAYDVVGRTVREASRQGIAGRHITGAMLDEAATVVTGAPWGLTGSDLTAALDPRLIIESRRGKGGAAPGAVDAMLQQCEQKVEHLSAAVAERQARLADAQQRLLDDARSTLGDREEA
jgi:argininosuccinate lyase